MPDVLVIGAGAAGAALSWRLATRGFRVTCLEQGGWTAPESGPGDDPAWERRRLGDWHPNPNRRRAAADFPVDDSDSPFRPLMWNGVGGSTVLWSAHLPRLHPSDFRVRTLDGVADDWPLSYAELAPYYALNEWIMGVAGLPGSAAYPLDEAPRLPPAPLLPAERRVTAAFDRLGWHWWPGDIGLNTRPHGAGRGACVNCGPCEIGCHHRAKASADVAYWPAALAAGVRLVTGARVAAIPTDAQGRAVGAEWVDATGTRRLLCARAVVVAANGVGTPRLLLLSASGRHPRGLANRSGLVGRRLMLHPLGRVIGEFDASVGGHRGITAGAITSHEFYETDPARGFLRGIKLQVMRSPGPALTALGGGGSRLPWGAAHRDRFAARFDRTLSVSICSDDLPEEENRVELSERLQDGHGLPAPRMVYQVGGNTRRALDWGLAKADALLAEAGAIRREAVPLVRDAGFHLMGTARMGEDPERSVCDRFGRTHDVPNLFVADGSLFVTAGAVNPTNTLQALALRLADHIAGTARELVPPGA
ncbi:GMC family oxidoreductase [Roseomonas sp. BN140053]|uniref:GMC family oxidoreductase n=1 Tax=Roseomonas sp. BN140053 TaxID=3391898 RepID=UPI0039ED4B0F